MRPTELNFRSPKEKTAEFSLPVVTNQGNILFEIASSKKKPNFSKCRRFPNYEESAKITGYMVGPGSYHMDQHSIAKSHIKGTHVYKNYYRMKDPTNNGYIFIGNHLMFDANFLLPSRKHPTQEMTAIVDTGEIKQIGNSTFNRLSTASNSPGRKRNQVKHIRVMSPNYEANSFGRTIFSHY